VPGLDEVLGGGLPEYSCAVIVGGPGAGKTTLAQQILFANTSSARPGLYVTGPGEPPSKLLRHQQSFRFFDFRKLNRDVHVFSLSQRSVEDDPASVVDAVAGEIADRQAAFVVLDLAGIVGSVALWRELIRYLLRSGTTSIVVADDDLVGKVITPALSMADTIIRLHASVDRRTVAVSKARGQAPQDGTHEFRLNSDGARVFPRWPTPISRKTRVYPLERLLSGIKGLDGVIGGGFPVGDSVLLEGPSGSGKSLMATHFIVEGGHQCEPGLVLLFDDRPDRFIARADDFDLELGRLIRNGLVDVLSFRGRDVGADELIYEIYRAVSNIGARRLVLDPVDALESTLGAHIAWDCLWRLLDGLTGAGVTVWLNSSPEAGRRSFRSLVDDVIALNESQLNVVKMRWSAHSTERHAYTVDERGVVLTQQETPVLAFPMEVNGNGAHAHAHANGFA
jgi:circadian clock protein KaiC